MNNVWNVLYLSYLSLEHAYKSSTVIEAQGFLLIDIYK